MNYTITLTADELKILKEALQAANRYTRDVLRKTGRAIEYQTLHTNIIMQQGEIDMPVLRNHFGAK